MENVSLSLDSVVTTTEAGFSPSSSNDTQYMDEDIFQLVKIISILCYSITFVIGIIGNGLVIWIAGFKMKKMVNTIWFLNLAIADLIFNIFLPLPIMEWTIDGHWPLGQIMCKVIYAVIYLNMYVSISFLMIISIDRCIFVLCPVWSKNHRTPRIASVISVATWLLCLVLCSPYISFYDTVYDENQDIMFCTPTSMHSDDNSQWRYNLLLVVRFITIFLVPFTITLICYCLIVFRVKTIRCVSESGRTFSIIITIVLCFFCCWFPFHFLPVLPFMNIKMNENVSFVLLSFSCCLAFFNTCLNPLIYVFIGRDFKKSFMKSIPSLLENALRERCITDTEFQSEQSMMATPKRFTDTEFL